MRQPTGRTRQGKCTCRQCITLGQSDLVVHLVEYRIVTDIGGKVIGDLHYRCPNGNRVPDLS